MAHLQSISEVSGFKDFIIKRLTRIVPLYWLVTFFWAFVLARPAGVPTDKLLQSLFFIPTADSQTVVGPGWTLNIEIFFYILFGIITYTLKRSAVWVGVAFLILNAIHSLTGSYFIKLYCDPIVWAFFGGMVVFHVHKMPAIVSDSIYILGIGALLLLSTIFWHLPDNSTGIRQFFPWVMSSIILVLGAVSMDWGGKAAWVFNSKIMLLIGDSSYSLYLVHACCFFGVSNVLLYNLKVQNYITPDGAILLYLAVCCFISIIVHLCVEKPINRLIRKVISRSQDVRRA